MEKESIKEYVIRVWKDCTELKVKSKPFKAGVVVGILVSLAFTPIIGIPLGMMTASHYAQKNKKSKIDYDKL